MLCFLYCGVVRHADRCCMFVSCVHPVAVLNTAF